MGASRHRNPLQLVKDRVGKLHLYKLKCPELTRNICHAPGVRLKDTLENLAYSLPVSQSGVVLQKIKGHIRMLYAKSPADLLSSQETLARSGLEFLQQMLAGEVPSPPISETLGFRVTKVELGRVEFRGAPDFASANVMGTVHGGWYGTLLDSAMACAVMTHVPRGSVCTTLEFKVNILRPIPIGMEIACVGETNHAGGSTGVAQGHIKGVENGTLYATGSTTCMIMDMAGRKGNRRPA